jgi:hypothetical protein
LKLEEDLLFCHLYLCQVSDIDAASQILVDLKCEKNREKFDGILRILMFRSM